MLIRKITQIPNVNKLGLYIFQPSSMKDHELLITTSDGYPDYYRAELAFSKVEYTNCDVKFMDAQLRLASLQELPVHREYSGASVFCFEVYHEVIPIERYFVVASDVEITVYYGGRSLDHMGDLFEPSGP